MIILCSLYFSLFFDCNREMMDQFVSDISELWTEVGLELKPRQYSTDEPEESGAFNLGKLAKVRFCPEGGETCEYCKKPILFEKLEAREKFKIGDVVKSVMLGRVNQHCHKPNCPQMVTSAA